MTRTYTLRVHANTWVGTPFGGFWPGVLCVALNSMAVWVLGIKGESLDPSDS